MRLGRKIAIAGGMVALVVLSGVLFVVVPRDLRPRSGIIGVSEVMVHRKGESVILSCEDHVMLCEMIEAALAEDEGAFRGRLSIATYAPRVQISGEDFTMVYLVDGVAINADRDGDGGGRTQVVRGMTASDAALLESVVEYVRDLDGDGERGDAD